MGFEIKLNTGDVGEVWLRGCGDGTVEMCKWETLKPLKDQDKSIVREGLVPFKYYASIEQAMEKVIRMRVGSSQAATLKELVQTIKAIRSDLHKELGIALKSQGDTPTKE
jgi:hypothetical protein